MSYDRAVVVARVYATRAKREDAGQCVGCGSDQLAVSRKTGKKSKSCERCLEYWRKRARKNRIKARLAMLGPSPVESHRGGESVSAGGGNS